MLWVIYAIDAEGTAERRAAVRPAHSAHVRGSGVPIVLMGRLTAEHDESVSVGSLLVVEAPARADVEALVAADPFFTSGVWKDVHVRPFVQSKPKAASAASA